MGNVGVCATSHGKERGTAMYTYKIIKENVVTGERAKRSRTISRLRPLEIGGLYLHLGNGYPGAYRVLALIKEERSMKE